MFTASPRLKSVVGYQNKTVTAGDRAMRSAATFLNVGENPTAIKISDIKQTVGDPGDLTLCLYDDNVTRQAQYIYLSAEVAEEAGVEAGWYVINNYGEPNLDAGPQSADLPLGQGCVIISGNSSAEYTSAGAVDSIVREFKVTAGARKMMGNILPRAITLSELKQTSGDPGDLTFCTYDNNVTRLAQYIYLADEVAQEAGVAAGWYSINNYGEPDLDAGAQDFEIASGAGFVVVSGNSNAVLTFPKAM